MKLLDEVKQIIEKYDLKPIELPDGYKDVYNYLRDFPSEVGRFETNKEDGFLYDKYRSFIPRGWYGFSLGSPIVPEWVDIIDEILELCIIIDPNLEIHQIKLKWGGIRFYVNSNLIEDIDDIEFLLEDTFQDEALVY